MSRKTYYQIRFNSTDATGEAQQIDMSFDKKYMIGCSTLEQALVFSTNIRTNGDKKFYVPKCSIAQKLEPIRKRNFWFDQGRYWAKCQMKHSEKTYSEILWDGEDRTKDMGRDEKAGWLDGIQQGLKQGFKSRYNFTIESLLAAIA